MQRRKFIIGAGALASGSAAAVGTGAFSSASIEGRQADIELSTDSESLIALVPGDSEDIYENDDGELTIDFEGSEGEGVNRNAKYTWGDPDNPQEDYAFKIANNANEDYNDVTFTYTVENDEWIEEENWEGQSGYDVPARIRFVVYDQLNYPDDFVAPDVAGPGTNPSSETPDYSLESGESWPVVVEIDTTGRDGYENLSDIEQDLSGTLEIEVG